MKNNDIEMARRLAERVAEAGGRVYYVGGFVRDRVAGRDNKDVDVEVHGIAPGMLEEILDSLGTRTVMGASFGIYGLRHYDLDIAMPRSEKATGRGHKDFEVFVDPFLGAEKAAKRRDFTINALMQDVLTDEVLDFFGGLDDLKRGIIRHVNDQSFQEDPLRVFRAAQFASRFAFKVAPETIALCSGMDVTALANERIMEELAKGLLKGVSPRVFFDVLREMDQLRPWFEPVEAIAGDDEAYESAMNALSRAAKRRTDAEYPLGMMLSALAWHFQGESPREKARRAEAFLSTVTTEARLKKYVCDMVLRAGEPGALFRADAGRTEYMKLFDQSVSPEDLALFARVIEGDDSAMEARLTDMLGEYRRLMAREEVRGADLISRGMKPGKQMGELLRYAHALHLEGVSREEALERVLAAAGEMRP